jgi:hypothetical protein
MTLDPWEIAHAGEFSHLRPQRTEGHVEVKNEPGGRALYAGSAVAVAQHPAQNRDGQRPMSIKSRKPAIFEAGALLWGVTVKITALILVLLTLAMGTGAAMVVSVQKEPVLLACGGPNC